MLMLMMRTFKYRLHPSRSQERVLEQWLRQCCLLYNAALEQRITAWRQQRRSITRFDQTAQLTELRRSEAAWAVTPVEVHRSALRNVDLAYAAFFRRCRSGETPGFPRFRSSCRYDAFAIGKTTLHNCRVRVPKLGLVKLNLYRPVLGTIKNAVIRRDATGKWWVCFQCDLGAAPPKIPIVVGEKDVGIDLGLTTLATLSTGEKIPNPRYAKRAEDQLADRQRKLSRKKKGSRNRDRSRRLVAKGHAHVANQRLDHARKEAKKLYDRFDTVFYEGLSVGAFARGRLAKSFQDASWGLFLRCLASKAEEAGKHALPQDARNTSQLCSRCGEIVSKGLSDREHCCICGLTIDRDHNAAINVLLRGRRSLELTEEVGVEGEAS